MTIGRPRPAADAMPTYRPGKAAVQAEQEHGLASAIKLASNENPLPPITSIQDAIVAAASGTNRYADHGATEVRARIASWLGVDAIAVTVGCGSVGLLQQVYLTYVDPGDEVVYPWPSFEVYPIFTRLMGGTAVTVALDERYAMDLDAVADAVTERTKLIMLATPNNPTGTAVSTSDVAAMLDRVPPETMVVLDEAYREFRDPTLGDPVADLVPAYPNVIVTRTMSKAHGLAAVRFGYAVAHPEVVVSIDKTLMPFAVNGIAQAAALAAIDADEEIMERVRVVLGERSRVVDALVADGWDLPDAQANFVFLPVGDRTDSLYLELEKRGVVTRPFSGVGVRVTIGTAAENDRFLAALSETRAAELPG